VQLPREWIEKAEFFRREAARYLEEGVYWAVCFASHQAAELYLKALQVAILGVHDFTHDLSRLLHGLEEAGLSVPRELYMVTDALTPHYTLSRYPGRKPVTYDKGLAQRCLEYMERIVGWVLAQAGSVSETEEGGREGAEDLR